MAKDSITTEQKSAFKFLKFAFMYLGIALIGLLCMYVLLTMFAVEKGDDYKNTFFTFMIYNHISSNDLSQPFPNSNLVLDNLNNTYNPNIALEQYNQYYEEIFNRDLESFAVYLRNNYQYSVNGYDCKYWSAVWYTWYLYNKDDYNFKWKYINTDNHIYGMVYNDTTICTLDQKYVNCRGVNNG